MDAERNPDELATAAVELAGVSVVRRGAGLLRDVDWRVAPGEQWAVLGPNGAGKTTLLRVASARLHPSSGSATILGGRLGRTPVPALRPRVAVVERALAARFRPGLTALEVVLTGLTGTTALLSEAVDDDARARARDLLAHVRVDAHAERPFAELSEGERARTMLARALVGDAALLVLDEAVAGLDLAGRELFLDALATVSRARPRVAILVAGHHLEELPATVSHTLLLACGRVVAAGPVETTLTDELLSACYGLPARVVRVGGRLFATAG